MSRNRLRRAAFGLLALITAGAASGCEWRGLNSIALPGTAGGGEGAYTIQAQMPDVGYLQPNSRVRVGDVNVGNVTKIERQGWHALVTMTLDRDVRLPANAIAKVGQTSLLGSLHVELAPPAGVPAEGTLHDGSLISLANGTAYPSTEQTLAALSLVLNGGGLGQIQDITKALTTAWAGHEQDLRHLVGQIDEFVGHLNDQSADIIAASESLDHLVGQIAEQKPVVDKALHVIPEALKVLKDERNNLVDALDRFGKMSQIFVDVDHQSKEALVKELQAVGPVLESLANAGPALTRSLSFLATAPWPKETVANWVRGDYANLTAIIDLTLSRIDSSIFTGTRWEGNLTELEMQWGRTIGQLPSPYTAGNPLVAPYHFDQGH